MQFDNSNKLFVSDGHNNATEQTIQNSVAVPRAFLYHLYVCRLGCLPVLQAAGSLCVALEFRLGSGLLCMDPLSLSPAVTWGTNSWESQEDKRPGGKTYVTEGLFPLHDHWHSTSKPSHIAKPNIKWTEKYPLPVLGHSGQRN